MTDKINKPTSVFWIISVVAVIWNIMGVIAYLDQIYTKEEVLNTLPKANQNYYQPDNIKISKQKQAEKDKAFGNQNVESILKPAFETEEVRLPEPEQEESLDLPTRSEETTPEQEAVLFPNGKSDEQLAREITAKERFPINTSNIDVPDNPYSWSPEYTQRGYVEELVTNIVRGFGAFTIAVFAGVFGCVGLLMRKNWATILFDISLIALIFQFIYNVFTKNFEGVSGEKMIWPILVIFIALFLVWFSRNAAKKGWIS